MTKTTKTTKTTKDETIHEEQEAMHAGTMGERRPLAALPCTYLHAIKIPG